MDDDHNDLRGETAMAKVDLLNERGENSRGEAIEIRGSEKRGFEASLGVDNFGDAGYSQLVLIGLGDTEAEAIEALCRYAEETIAELQAHVARAKNGYRVNVDEGARRE